MSVQSILRGIQLCDYEVSNPLLCIARVNRCTNSNVVEAQRFVDVDIQEMCSRGTKGHIVKNFDVL